MVIAELIVVLDRARYRPGEVVSGEVRVRLDEDHVCSIELALRRDEWRGDTTTLIEEQLFLAGRWRAARFSLALPSDAPLSMESWMRWSVVATAKLPFIFSEVKESPFVVEDPAMYPHVLPCQVQAARSSVGRSTPVAVPGLVQRTGGARASLLGDLLKLSAGGGLVAASAVLIVLTKGAAAGTLALAVPGARLSRPALNRLRRFLAERRVGVVRVEYETVLEDAPRLAVRAFFEPALDEGTLSATLQVRPDFATAPDNQNKPLFEAKAALVRNARVSDLFEGALALPERPLASGELTPGKRVTWELEVVVDLPRWPDWVERFPLEVVPARRPAFDKT